MQEYDLESEGIDFPAVELFVDLVWSDSNFTSALEAIEEWMKPDVDAAALKAFLIKRGLAAAAPE